MLTDPINAYSSLLLCRSAYREQNVFNHHSPIQDIDNVV